MPQIIIDIIIAVGGLLLGAGIKAYIDLRKVKPEVEAIQAQADESEAKADKTKAEAWVMLITSYQGRFDQMERRITDQGCEIDKITQARIQAQKERDEPIEQHADEGGPCHQKHGQHRARRDDELANHPDHVSDQRQCERGDAFRLIQQEILGHANLSTTLIYAQMEKPE